MLAKKTCYKTCTEASPTGLSDILDVTVTADFSC